MTRQPLRFAGTADSGAAVQPSNAAAIDSASSYGPSPAVALYRSRTAAAASDRRAPSTAADCARTSL